MDELIANINNYTWYPTKEVAEENRRFLEEPLVLEAILERVNKNLIGRYVEYNKPKDGKVWRHQAWIKDNRLVIMYCTEDMGWLLWESKVDPSILLYGSLWEDLKYHETRKTAPLKAAVNKCTTCISNSLPDCCCAGEEPPTDEY